MRRRDERGVGVVAGVALLLGLVFVAGMAMVANGVVVAHRRTAAAADLAALGAAAAQQRGRDPCVAAGVVAAANHVEVSSCSVAGAAVTVVVRLELRGVLQGGAVQARARAGPED